MQIIARRYADSEANPIVRLLAEGEEPAEGEDVWFEYECVQHGLPMVLCMFESLPVSFLRCPRRGRENVHWWWRRAEIQPWEHLGQLDDPGFSEEARAYLLRHPIERMRKKDR